MKTASVYAACLRKRAARRRILGQPVRVAARKARVVIFAGKTFRLKCRRVNGAGETKGDAIIDKVSRRMETANALKANRTDSHERLPRPSLPPFVEDGETFR